MTAHDDSPVPFCDESADGPAAGPATVSTLLVLTLALQSAVPPFATDMYTPAFPQVTADLATSASLVGLTLTTFFLGMALGPAARGPVVGPAWPADADHRRRAALHASARSAAPSRRRSGS